MKLDGIAAFVAVAEAGSISEAARRLGLSKSVVSDRLKELERRLGASLIHRSTRRLSLTEDGSAFLERASGALRELDAAAADLAERRSTLAGPLRLSAPVTFSRLHLGPALYPFLARHPQIELTLDLDDRVIDAHSEGHDGVVRHGPLRDSRLVAWRLAPSRRVLVASPDYLARHGSPTSLAELDRHRAIFYTGRGVADWRFLTRSGAVQLRATPALRVNNGELMRDAAEAGLGIALLPLFISGPPLKAGTLQRIEIDAAPEPEFIYIAHPEGRRPTAKLRALADWLRRCFGDPPYWEP
ncbi:LysR family transcriptional regulator [Ancylobacter oerskovii]|uniref:LysR family transcriptional regulator n=1 Tax=Ancylobacter oerskovii TaxID=459519 RepID=A0ABW4YUJ1_9HYPH|nr:LysR family transcriptional regulator [Ancylobacter oerskovii]MBS7544500.1 LysR family transcriptional regulator [Ancylobacter oerskovii]